jgi:hypothetical protein
LTKKYDRPPTGAELYLVHQQGMGGSHAHRTQPQRAAWQSMHSTAEGKRRGAAWSKKAIWGNLPAAAKTKYGTVERVSSQDFMNWWEARFNRALEQTKLA